MIGTTVSRYQIVKRLGEEAVGDVYLAQDTELDRQVALKFLTRQLVSDTEELDRFRRQARAVAALDHPNILTVYEIGTHDGVPFIATEFVEGRTLAEMSAEEKLPPGEALETAIQLCEGLSAAHKAGIFFHEIKPENVLVGQDGRVRIAEFGHTIDDDSPALSLETRSIAAGDRPGGIDDSASVYSIGTLLERMDTEDQFREIVARATSDAPETRYSSVAALATDLVDARLARSDRASKKMTLQRIALIAAILIPLVLAVGYLVTRAPSKPADAPAAQSQRQVVAVLPFENLGNSEDEYFADGITDEITSRLALMQGLGVISRTSAGVYKGTTKTVREIGSELNTDYVLEGTIRWDKSRGQGKVRITPRLIRVTDDTLAWSSNYEREITEIFSMQAEIAAQIADALDVTLLANEREALTTQPTDNIDAYQAYLQGMKLLRAPDFSRESFELGVQMFERAVELDPEFALAHARLSSMHSRMVHYGYDRSDERFEMAKANADLALALQPDLAEAHLALGLYDYWGRRDYDQALLALAEARERAPNNSDILLATAYVKRREGDLEAAIELFERDLELSPLDANATVGLGETYGTLRRYAEGERAFERAIALAPDNAYPYTELALLYLRWRGDTDAARALLERMPSVRNAEECRVAYLVELLDRQYAAALDRLAGCPGEALEAGAFFIPVPLFEGMTLQLMGEPERARLAYDRSREVLERKLAQEPDDPRVHSALGLTYAGLGSSTEAVRHGRSSVDLYPLSRDALQAPVFAIDLALIYTMVGDDAAALEQLETVLSIPSILSTPWLRADPRWDPLSEDPGFTALFRKFPVGDR